jgi:excisionase family DNA binding protein
MNALMSIDKAAELLSISKWTVRHYIRSGKFRPVRLGRRVLLEEMELERLVAEGKNKNGLEVAQREEERPAL